MKKASCCCGLCSVDVVPVEPFDNGIAKENKGGSDREHSMEDEVCGRRENSFLEKK